MRKELQIELKNEDCFEYIKEIKSQSISLILIDPPYIISKETNFSTGSETGKNTDRFRVSMDFGEWDKENNIYDLEKLLEECYRVLKPSGTIICFYDLWKITGLKEIMEKANFKQIRLIEWLKTNPVPLNSKINYLTNVREIALLGVKKGKPTFNSSYDNGLYQYPICHDKNRFHPTQKPLGLIKDLILKHSNENDYILDCFSGSGTTAVAAFQTGRNFMGCEISKEYYDKSILRLKSEGVVI